MSYDNKGPWNPKDPGQHAPYEKSLLDIEYWLKRGVPAEKLVLGVPFYGHYFGSECGSKFYSDIVIASKENAYKDQVDQLWYNGKNTIFQKTLLTFEKKIGGIMIWEIAADTKDETSLLSSIWEGIIPRLPIQMPINQPYSLTYFDAKGNSTQNFTIKKLQKSTGPTVITNTNVPYIILKKEGNIYRIK